jgi:hypothetical protein
MLTCSCTHPQDLPPSSSSIASTDLLFPDKKDCLHVPLLSGLLPTASCLHDPNPLPHGSSRETAAFGFLDPQLPPWSSRLPRVTRQVKATPFPATLRLTPRPPLIQPVPILSITAQLCDRRESSNYPETKQSLLGVLQLTCSSVLERCVAYLPYRRSGEPSQGPRHSTSTTSLRKEQDTDHIQSSYLATTCIPLANGNRGIAIVKRSSGHKTRRVHQFGFPETYFSCLPF